MTDLKEPGLRERKRVATRHAIERAALDLSLDKGYENVTIDEIAESADVSPRTFFNYFPSKEAAVVGHGPHGPDPDEIEAFLSASADQPILDGIRNLLATVIDSKSDEQTRAAHELQEQRMLLMLRHPQLFRLRMETMEELTGKMIELVSRRLVVLDPALGADPAELRERARLVVFVSFAGLRNAWASWVDAGGKGRLAECVQRSFEQLHQLSSQVNV
ncbi:TetR/AcrR family transcriptional regulator [Gryllotalpicola daejeonensis]|uniref:TetR/AcrR family transcriptional regulator n=1 Tax=Gryllotalpicola daejeonensis TaxID=993087 RepID=A0ABP7ZNH2_9MICO